MRLNLEERLAASGSIHHAHQGQGFACNNQGACIAGCAPNCSQRKCGTYGCGGSCGSCASAYRCNNSGACDLDPSAIWTLTITRGTVTEKNPGGSAWDLAGGLPDAMVCVTIGGQRTCTTHADNTLMPVWNKAVTATANALLSGVQAEILEFDDLSGNDTICGLATVQISLDDFARQTWSGQCDYGSFSATLRPQ